MDAVRFGLALRALRRHHRWTQAHLAERAGVSQAAVSRAERGEAEALTVRTLDVIATALGARASVRVFWHGEALDRLLDAAHAGLVEQVIRLLAEHGWETVPEVTFNHFGDRGSVDVLAYHPGRRALLIVEVKSVVPDLQAMLAALDRKVRLGAHLAAGRGWRPLTVSALLVLPDERTARRRIAQHEATISAVLPKRTMAARAWLANPVGSVDAVIFLPSRQRTTARHRVAAARQATPPRIEHRPAG